MQEVKNTHKAEAKRAKEQAEDMRETLDTIAENQQILAEEQRVHQVNLQAMKDGVLKEIQGKLAAADSALQSISSNVPTGKVRGGGQSYADKAAHIPAASDMQHPVLNYLDMERKQPNARPAATQTNGNLARVYIKDWRTEPVGAVKRALRQAIATWVAQQEMVDNEAQEADVMVDIDSVRHLNQFGTPEKPIMEIACTPERVGLVKRFFQESEIPLWDDNINPLLDPEYSLDDR